MGLSGGGRPGGPGNTFAEVVLRHTLVYQVEHAFLIHGHTGLLIAHAAAENATSQDPQLVSSMLTAIQDFIGIRSAVRNVRDLILSVGRTQAVV